MGVLILQVNWQCDTSAERKAKCFVGAHRRNGEDVCNQNVEHNHLVTEGLALLHYHSNFSVLVKGMN